MIEEFLKIKSCSDGGYAPVGLNDIVLLRNILKSILDLKYERDADGDLPVGFILIDKTKERFPPFEAIKHDASSLKKLSDTRYNADVANQELSRIITLFFNERR